MVPTPHSLSSVPCTISHSIHSHQSNQSHNQPKRVQSRQSPTQSHRLHQFAVALVPTEPPIRDRYLLALRWVLALYWALSGSQAVSRVLRMLSPVDQSAAGLLRSNSGELDPASQPARELQTDSVKHIEAANLVHPECCFDFLRDASDFPCVITLLLSV